MKTNLLQHQKADLWHPAFIPSDVMNSDVSEVTQIDKDILSLNVPDEVQERAADTLWLDGAAADGQIITKYVHSEKWCGDQRTKWAVVKVHRLFLLLPAWRSPLVLASVMFPDQWSLIGP